MHIDEIPQEILEKFFNVYVWQLYQSRKVLLLVSKTWHQVATGYAPLWQYFCLWPDAENSPKNAIVCRSLRQVPQLVTRAGHSFDIWYCTPRVALPEEDVTAFKSAISSNWTSACRKFTLKGPTESWKTEDSLTVGEILKDCNFESLETLEFDEGNATKTWDHMYECLIDRVEATALNLRTLKSRDVNAFFQRPAVLERIRTARFISCSRTPPWEHLRNLETLHLDGLVDEDGNDASALDAPNLTDLTLGGDTSPKRLPYKIFEQLTHLTFTAFTISDMPIISLPSLIYLHIHATLMDLSKLHAPVLQEFACQLDGFDLEPYKYPSFSEATFSPRVLRLDIASSDGQESDIFSDFAQPLRIWQRLEEVHLTVTSAEVDIPDTLFNALSGPYYPHLQCLTAIWHLKSGVFAEDDVQKTGVEQLLRVRNARIAAGLTSLDKVEAGWFPADYGHLVEEISRESWAVEWTDCLTPGVFLRVAS